MFQGLRTVIYHVNDLAKATGWYTKVVGKPPYFHHPFYVGFEVGGYELGLLPDGEGIRVATVIDPFGNVVGIIENPHFNAGKGG